MIKILTLPFLMFLNSQLNADFTEGSAKSPVRGSEIGPDSEMIENTEYDDHLSNEEEEGLKELQEMEDEESQLLFDYDNPNEFDNKDPNKNNS